MTTAGKIYLILCLLILQASLFSREGITPPDKESMRYEDLQDKSAPHKNTPHNNISDEVLNNQFRHAMRLYGEKKYFDAITEFKRLLFFDRKNRYGFTASFHIAESYKAGAWLDEAIKYYNISYIRAGNDSLAFIARLGIIRCNILRRTTRQALLLLEQTETDRRFKGRIAEIHYWRGWAYIFEDNWKKASGSFAYLDPLHPLKKLSDSVANEKYSVSFAKVISYILPGSGQFYTGNYLSGIMSLGWTAAMAYFTAEAFMAERIFDGFVTTSLFLRFHRGNVQNAEEFALTRNLEISNKALYFLQKNYEGLKP